MTENIIKPSRKSIALLICLAIILTGSTIYWQVGNYGFTSFDDNGYITENAAVSQGLTIEAVKWAFDLNVKHFYWQPVTWLSHMLDVELFGLNAGPHHLINVLIHIINSLLVFALLSWLTGKLWRSGFVAVLFIVHPLNVESVAWIAERKNVLSTFFWLLTMLTYIRYAVRPTIAGYLLTLLVFGLGVLTKPMLVTLPFTLLLLDYWPLKRLDLGQRSESPDQAMTTPTGPMPLIIEKAPLLALALTVALIVSNSAPIVTFENVPLNLRLANAITLYWHYLAKMVMPLDLAMYYPYPAEINFWPTVGAALWLMCVTAVVLKAYKCKPYLTMGWLWYLGTLVPVLGLIQAGFWPAVADRWAYVPMIGLFIIIAWGVPELVSARRWRKPLLTVTTVTILIILATASWRQTKYWADDIALYTHAIEVGSGHPLIYSNLGAALAEKNRLDEAIDYYRAALQGSSDYADVHNNLGSAFARLDRPIEAIAHFRETLRIDPEHPSAKKNLEKILTRQENLAAKIKDYREELKKAPDSAALYNKLGSVYARSGRIEEAVQSYITALDKDPDHKRSYNDLGIVLLREGYVKEALPLFRKALEIDPEFIQAQKNLALAAKTPVRKDVKD
jgi:Flp pilus assembly protein TadD